METRASGRRGGKPLVLLFNDMFGRVPDAEAMSACEHVAFTRDREAIDAAAAVIFHIPTLYGPGSVRKRPGQVWVAWSMESEANYPQLADPDFMAAFDLTMTYRRDADIWCPYLPKAAEIERALAAPLPRKSEAAPAVLIQSATIDRCGRNDYARALMAEMTVDSWGRFLNNRALPDEDRGAETKLAIISRYRFCLAFENSIAPDYVTEKFFQPFLAGTVPVYRGTADVRDFAPGPHSWIDASDFDGPRDLAAHLVRLAADEAEYLRFFDWRESGPGAGFLAMVAQAEEPAFCRLAGRLAERLGLAGGVTRTSAPAASASS